MAWGGLAAQVWFVGSFLLAGLWQGPRYSVLAHSMSDMYAVTAPGGWFLVVAFTLYGVAMLVFAALAVWPTLKVGNRWWAGSACVVFALSIYGLGNLLSPWERLACRMADPGCTSAAQVANSGGALDDALSFPGIVLFFIAVLLAAEAMKRTPGWRAWAWPARWWGIGFFLLLVGSTVAFGMNLGLDGLIERLLAASGAVGLGVFAWGIARKAGEAKAAEAA